jgi:hypothetical protein
MEAAMTTPATKMARVRNWVLTVINSHGRYTQAAARKITSRYDTTTRSIAKVANTASERRGNMYRAGGRIRAYIITIPDPPS